MQHLPTMKLLRLTGQIRWKLMELYFYLPQGIA